MQEPRALARGSFQSIVSCCYAETCTQPVMPEWTVHR